MEFLSLLLKQTIFNSISIYPFDKINYNSLLFQKKIPPALPARGSSVITTVPSLSPKNKVPIPASEQSSIGIHMSNAGGDDNKNNCDTKKQYSEGSIDNESSKSERNEAVDSSIDSVDGSNATLKKSYETDMI